MQRTVQRCYSPGNVHVSRGAKHVARATQQAVRTDIKFFNPAWSSVHNEQQFFATLQAEVDAGRCPKQLIPAWLDFYNNYRNAVLSSPEPDHTEELAAHIQSSIADTVLNQFHTPYTFPSFHERILEPYNYYDFGQNYVGSLIDFSKSVLGHPDRWGTIKQQLKDKHNVVLLANHQTEADPGVFAHMLSELHVEVAQGVIYVAGDRVVTDAFCKPFSMGRNLFCVHSKKHMNDIPELKTQKMDTNRKTLVAMSRKLNEGGCLIWIAPSGGRDRPDENDKWRPDRFDPTAVELMRNLAARAKQPGHLYPMAMFSWPIMPPPKTVDKSIGERRLTNYSGVGISVGAELDIAAIISASDVKEEQQVLLANEAWHRVTEEYEAIDHLIDNPQDLPSMPGFIRPQRAS
jgi:glycerol-3-phosphate O-acyltransferase